ncbi:MAG: histidinol-phosphatase [Alphaproteobacteria bacterium]|nr:histidinol-phosphatase [Alphaproteobacteria bacterium]
MTDACAEEFVELAGRMANAAGEISLKYFRREFDVEAKSDATPVTTADREAELAMRALIEAEQPAHGIVGEEFDPVRPDAEYLWVLDPIDGTKAFACGIPVFTNMIALLRAGEPILGVISQPVLGERWVGAGGRPTTFNGEPASVRPASRLADVALLTTSPGMFEEGDDMAAYERLEAACWYRRLGLDCYAYGLLASGYVQLIAEAQMKIHDYMPLVRVVEGAGGVITDWRGGAIGLDSSGHVLAAASAELHAQALALLAG